MTREDITNKQIIEVLEKKAGLLAPTAKALGISRQTIYRWIESDQELKDAVKSCRETVIDMAESVLMEKIQGKETVATLFYLKTIGRERGYVERQEYAEHKEQPLFPDDEDETDTED